MSNQLNNKAILKFVIFLIAVGFLLVLVTMLNGSDIVKESWTLPVMAAEIWTIALYL